MATGKLVGLVSLASISCSCLRSVVSTCAPPERDVAPPTHDIQALLDDYGAPPGTGVSLPSNASVFDFEFKLSVVDAPAVVSGVSGKSCQVPMESLDRDQVGMVMDVATAEWDPDSGLSFEYFELHSKTARGTNQFDNIFSPLRWYMLANFRPNKVDRNNAPLPFGSGYVQIEYAMAAAAGDFCGFLPKYVVRTDIINKGVNSIIEGARQSAVEYQSEADPPQEDKRCGGSFPTFYILECGMDDGECTSDCCLILRTTDNGKHTTRSLSAIFGQETYAIKKIIVKRKCVEKKNATVLFDAAIVVSDLMGCEPEHTRMFQPTTGKYSSCRTL